MIYLFISWSKCQPCQGLYMAAIVSVQEKLEKQGMNEAKPIFFFFTWGDENILSCEMTKKHKWIGKQCLFSLVLLSEVKLHASHHVWYPSKILTPRHLRNVEFENHDQTPGFCLRRRAKKSIRRLFWKQIIFTFLKMSCKMTESQIMIPLWMKSPWVGLMW